MRRLGCFSLREFALRSGHYVGSGLAKRFCREMKSILVLSDFSPQARNAIRFAIQRFSPSLESLIILNAIFSNTHPRNTLIRLDDILQERSERGLASDLAFAHELVQGAPVQVKTFGFTVRYDEAIRNVLQEDHVDLILMAPLDAFAGTRPCSLKLDEHGLAQTFNVPVLAIPAYWG